MAENMNRQLEEQLRASIESKGFKLYPASVFSAEETAVAVVMTGEGKRIAAIGRTDMFDGIRCDDILLCELVPANAKALHALLPFTKPVRIKGDTSIGLGDRLGNAGPGQLRAIRKYNAFPVLAQQSIRELTLTNRTFDDVIAAATFAVLEEGYTDGYGADGDHLKTKEEIGMAIKAGCSMITLDCSEKLHDEFIVADMAEVEAAYAAVPAECRAKYEADYLDREQPMVGAFSREDLMRCVAAFHDVLTHAEECFAFMQEACGGNCDFELSIDETPGITSPKQHFFITNELYGHGVSCTSVAPHFTGEFEKALDYVGDLRAFADEVRIHQEIAEHFGYKLSLHSGSDKFTVYTAFAGITGKKMHVKTAGTHWLEAVRLVSYEDPQLFRRAVDYSLAMYGESSKYYHVTADIKKIPPVELLSNLYLPELVDKPESRQLLHISYGVLLDQGWFKRPLYELLAREEEKYYGFLEHHTDRHLKYLFCV